MNSVELMDKRNQLKIQAESILSVAEKESRKLTDEEDAAFQDLKKQMKEVDEEMRDLTNKLNNN